MIPGEIFTSFAEFQGIVSVHDFRIPIGLQELLQASLGFLWSFCFCTDMPGSIEWPSPAQLLHIGDCFEIRNCHWGPCDLLLLSHQNFQHEVQLHYCVICMGPCNFRPFTDLAISVFREMNINTVLTQILTSLVCGLYRYFMRRTGVRVSVYWNFIIHQILPEFLQPFRNLRIVTQVPPFNRGLFFYGFLEFGWLGFPQVPPFYHQPI